MIHTLLIWKKLNYIQKHNQSKKHLKKTYIFINFATSKDQTLDK